MTLLTAIQVIGAVVGAVGAISSGRAQASAANTQAQIQQQQATRERQNAAAQEEDFRRRASRLKAERRAGLGAQGVTGEGTPLLVDEDIAAEAELQALRIRNGGQVNETRLRQQAGLTAAGGAAKRKAGFFRAGASLLSGLNEAFG